MWESLYPTAGLTLAKRSLLMQLEAGMPDFVKLLIQHRPKALRGQSLIEAMQVDRYQPRRLAAHYERWRTTPEQLYRASPSFHHHTHFFC